MTTEGPPLESLTRRLAETPADFLAEPRIGAAGTVNVAAVVSDTLRDIGGAPLPKELLVAFQPVNAKQNRNRLAAVLVGCWLLHDPWFVPVDHAIVGIVDQHVYDDGGYAPKPRHDGGPR